MRSEKLSRRDFLKAVGAVGIGFVLAGCKNKVEAVNDVVQKLTPEPSLTPEIDPTQEPDREVFSARIEGFEDFDFEKFKLETGVPLPDEYMTPFRVEVKDVEFDFVALPPVVNTEGKLVNDERLFLEVNGEWSELHKSFSDDGKVIMWQYWPVTLEMDQLVELEPVLWYPATKEGWEEMSQPFAVFAPPSVMEGLIDGYGRDDDGGIPIERDMLPEGVKKALFSLVAVEMWPMFEDLRKELDTETWKLQEPVKHEDGTWLLYRQNSVTNRRELVRIYKEGEWRDYMMRLESPNGRVFWDVGASWYEYTGKPEAITMWRWNPDIPDASARWQEAAYRALWSLAAYAKDDSGRRLNSGITLEQITEGAEFYYVNNQGETVRVDTSQPVRFVWDLNSKNWPGHNYTYSSVEKFWEKVDADGSVLFYFSEVLLNEPFRWFADFNYWYVLRAVGIPDVMNGQINANFYYDYYIRDNPNPENYDEIERLLYDRVFRGKKPDGAPDEYPQNADLTKELLQVKRGEGFVSPYD